LIRQNKACPTPTSLDGSETAVLHGYSIAG
jgi:hypothetical protein